MYYVQLQLVLEESGSVCEEITVSTCKVSSIEIIPGIIDILTHTLYHIIIWIELQNFVPLIRIQHHLIFLVTVHAKCLQLSESL